MKIISGKIGGAQKVAIYGPEGIGKTSLAAAFPNPLFIDTEGSTKELDVRRTERPVSWSHLLSMVEYVKNNSSICDTLVIDTADWAEQLCAAEICSKAGKTGIEDFGFGKGYIYLAEEFGKLLNMLSDLTEFGVNTVTTAHALMRKFEQPDELGAYDRWELKLQKKTAPLLKEWADMLLFANYKTYVVNVDKQGVEKGKNKAQGGKRVLYTTHHPCWDAKNRHNLPPEIDLSYASIAHCIPDNTPDMPRTTPSDLSVERAKANINTVVDDSPATISELTPVPEQTALTDYSLPDDIPAALAELMRPEQVTPEEIQNAVASKGYYPADTPIQNYDAQFVQGVLVAAWPQVFSIIKNHREDLPF